MREARPHGKHDPIALVRRGHFPIRMGKRYAACAATCEAA